ncbi:hypothetical protein ACFL2V_11075 [Pseudomonadota bacterium]
MAVTYLSIQEASELSGKSIQTIRRAIKSRKLTSKKKKTPQGYNYQINKESVLKYYKIKAGKIEREAGGIKTGKSASKAVSKEYATQEDMKNIQTQIEKALNENQKERENFVRLMQAFQDKFIALENQLKLLEDPRSRKWYEFWK